MLKYAHFAVHQALYLSRSLWPLLQLYFQRLVSCLPNFPLVVLHLPLHAALFLCCDFIGVLRLAPSHRKKIIHPF